MRGNAVGAPAANGSVRSSGRRRALVVFVVLAVLGTATTAAWATAPGKNGKIAFRRLFNGERNRGALFTANPNGSAIRQITHPAKGVLDIEPDWSPNGRRIAFQRVDSNGCGPGCETDEIDVVNADGSRLTRLVHDAPGKGCMKNGLPANGVCRHVPAWSPNGKQIAFECVMLRSAAGNPYLGHICVMNRDGSNVRQLAQTPATGAADSAPAWSPDGRHIAFQRAVQNERRDTVRDGVFVMNADGSDPRRVTPWALRAAQPDWSPNGRRILFYSNWSGPASVSANLYTISPKGAGLKQLTRARRGKVQYLSATFSPDGKWITFGKTPGTGKDGNADIFIMRANGTQARHMTRTAIWDSGADWGPRG